MSNGPTFPPLDIAILGAGAAGMMAGVAAAEATVDPATGRSRLRIGLFEKNAQPGIKVLVCGGGRCNFTNAGSIDFLIEQFGRNGRFLTPALRHLDNDALREWFAAAGVPSHEEHDGKIYPDSNQAKSVVNALLNRMNALGVQVHAGADEAIATIEKPEARSPEPEGSMPEDQPDAGRESAPLFHLSTTGGTRFAARSVILAVGGMSYQRMGTTGDGYRLAAALGHSIVTPRPAIVALLCKEEWPKTLSGLAIADVEIRIEVEGPLPRLATGKPTPSVNDLLFTHFGLSGPAILNPSEIVAELLEKFPAVGIRVDFLRHQSHDQLAATLRSWQQHHGKKLIRKQLATLVPIRLAEKICELLSIHPEQTCSTLTSAQMHQLIERLKVSRFSIHATRGFKEAMVTAGGVKLDEVDPRTMQSKLVPGLYLVGEVLDLTGPSGGYNLQLAFSTGHLAGTHAARTLQA